MKWWWSLWCLVCLVCALPHPCHAQLTVSAVFDQRGVKGNITFSQNNSTSNTTITVNLEGMYMCVCIIMYIRTYVCVSYFTKHGQMKLADVNRIIA